MALLRSRHIPRPFRPQVLVVPGLLPFVAVLKAAQDGGAGPLFLECRVDMAQGWRVVQAGVLLAYTFVRIGHVRVT